MPNFPRTALRKSGAREKTQLRILAASFTRVLPERFAL